MIAAVAIRNDVPVLHDDRDYDVLAQYTALTVVRSDRRSRRAVAAVRAGRRRPAGRARADGGHHEYGVPPAVPLVPAGRVVRVGDDHDARARRTQSQDAAPDPLRAGRVAALDPALRRGPSGRRCGGADDRRRGSRRPRRPELRLPGAEGDPSWRRIGAAVAHRAVLGRRVRCGAGCRRGRARHDQDAPRHRCVTPDLSRGGTPCTGRRRGTRRRTRTHCRRVLRRDGELGTHRGTRVAAGHSGARQRRHLGSRRCGYG